MNNDEGVPDTEGDLEPLSSDPAAVDLSENDTVEVSEPAPTRQDMPRPISARTEIPFGLIVFLIIAILLVIFTVQNSSGDIPLKFLVWEGSYPLALIIIGVVAVTIILDEVLGLFLRRRKRKRFAEKQELKRLREMNG